VKVRRSRSPARTRAAAAGLLVATCYLAAAAWSGHLSPLARRPLLDGPITPLPYRWVTPPPELAATNQAPTPGDFTVAMKDGASRAAVLTTPDAQVTVILRNGAFPGVPGATKIHLTVEPLDAATLPGGPDKPLQIIGNAYRFAATYEPSGDRVQQLGSPMDLILIYPTTPNGHVATHTVVSSADGTAWATAKGLDTPTNQQAEGPVPTLGYAAVAGDVTSLPSPVGPTGSGNNTLGIALIVGAVCAALVGIGLLARGRNR
jgi:hypothetical protein